MSWSSRLPSFGGRWSPFNNSSDARSSKPSQPIQVQESDYSYITPDELDSTTPIPTTTTSYASSKSTSGPAPPTPSSLPRPPKETDVLIFRHGKSRYPVHFPAYGLSDGQISIGDARAQAARKLDVADPKRVRMFFKGRNLKDDRAACRAEGLVSEGADAEILCVVGDASAAMTAPGGEGSGDSDSEDGGVDISGLAGGEEDGDAIPKRKRNRNRKKKGKRTPNASNSAADSATSSPNPPSTPLTPYAKLDAIATVFRTTLLPQCVAFTSSPPVDTAKRAFDHKRITETILAQVLLKLDAVETEGEEAARLRRKELVREVQGWLNRLDEVAKM